jgi:endonuclease G
MEGTMFDVLGDGEVSVPTHFFKVIVIETHDGQLELESYMMPNGTPDEGGDETKLEDYLTPLCQIEHHSGLIFFPEKKCFSSNNRRRGARLHAL